MYSYCMFYIKFELFSLSYWQNWKPTRQVTTAGKLLAYFYKLISWQFVLVSITILVICT